MKREGAKTKYSSSLHPSVTKVGNDKPDPNIIKIGNDEYEVIPQQAVAASNVIVKMWEYLGKPSTPLSKSGKKLMTIMISVWEDTWPKESARWYAERKEYKNAELSIKEQVHRRTGRSLASYPYPLFNMMKKVFPGFDPAERNNAIKLVRAFPIFQMANKI